MLILLFKGLLGLFHRSSAMKQNGSSASVNGNLSNGGSNNVNGASKTIQNGRNNRGRGVQSGSNNSGRKKTHHPRGKYCFIKIEIYFVNTNKKKTHLFIKDF